MRMKRIPSVLLAAALTVSLAAPAGAVRSSFTDIQDDQTAVNADILNLMGVVQGVGNQSFQPQADLSRAAFSTMVVKFMQEGDNAANYATRTIFADVTSRHWALPYVNLAASLTVPDGERQVHLLAGRGDGNFYPDDSITVAEATAIVLRVLGYNSRQTGSVWPDSFMNLAGSIGLTDQIAAEWDRPMTRAQAAQLFTNALICPMGTGPDAYYTKLGTPKEDVILLAVGVKTDDGRSEGAIRTSVNQGTGAYLAAAGEVKPTALQGKRGTLVLNGDNRIVTFVPDDSDSIHIVLFGPARSGYLQDTKGNRYIVNEDTMLYLADGSEGRPYEEGRTDLQPGTDLTLFSENGRIVAVYGGGSTSASGGAMVVRGTPSVAMFHRLTGGASDFKVVKNRTPIALSDLKPYDVVTYDSLNHVLIASDLRLKAVYEDAEPNPKAPQKIKVLNGSEGCNLEVLDTAWDSISSYRLGDTVVLLLTADGQVAGMEKPSPQVQGNAMGIVRDGTAEVFLPNGKTLTLTGTLEHTHSGGRPVNQQLVEISGYRAGQITASALPQRQARADFDIASMELDGHPVAQWARLFEKVGRSKLTPISWADLNRNTIPASNISNYHLTDDGIVDSILVENLTGDTYSYGIVRDVYGKDEDGRDKLDPNVLEFEMNGSSEQLNNHYAYRAGSWSGIIKGENGVAAVVELQEQGHAKPSDFFFSQGVPYVTVEGKTYRIADEVNCYKAENKAWFTEETGRARLTACRAFSDDLTIYVDPIGEKVRIVVAN